MSVYNTKEEWLRQAISSVLRQTLTNFEFIIITDNPSDNSVNVIEEYANEDRRIRLIKNTQNYGLTRNLNYGLSIAKGKYIARMDSDDISHEDRFQIQFEYMEKNPGVSVLGAYVDAFDEHGIIGLTMNECDDNNEIERIRMLFYNAGITHSTAFIRKSFLEEKNIIYNEELKKSQDYGLWVDILNAGGVIKELHEILVDFRIHSNQITQKNSTEQNNAVKEIVKNQLNPLVGDVSEEELKLHLSLYKYEKGIAAKEYTKYIKKLIVENNELKIYDSQLFQQEVNRIWTRAAIRGLIKYGAYSVLGEKYTYEALRPSNFIYMLRYYKKMREDNKILKKYERQLHSL